VPAATADFPLAVGQCVLPAAGAGCVPSGLLHVPFDNIVFTSLSSAAASAANDDAHIPAACCAFGSTTCGGGQTSLLQVGDAIGINNGEDATTLQLAAGCLSAGLTEFTVPVVACPTDISSAPVVGFARIAIDHVLSTGAASMKGIYVRVLCDDTCGNGTCGAGESCTSCPADCGGCP
jgi:hypothetical protein